MSTLMWILYAVVIAVGFRFCWVVANMERTYE